MGTENRVAVITGATGGLGRVVTRQMAESGVRLVLVGSQAEKLDALSRELKQPPEQWIPVAVDLSQVGSAQKVLDVSLARFGRVDLLLHLVGGWTGGKAVPEVPVEEVESMLQQHLWPTFYLAKVFGPHMVANRWGRIVVVSSPSASAPPAKGLPYSVGKSAQEALMLTLAEELKGTGVTANILRVRTIDVKHERDRQPSEKTAAWTTPEEIASAIRYLSSDEGGTVNGARIPLYGSP